MSECSLALFAKLVWLNADRMRDTNPVGGGVDKFQPAIITVPLGGAVNFEHETLVVLEVVAGFENVADAELQRTSVVGPFESIEVVADETVKVVSVHSHN